MNRAMLWVLSAVALWGAVAHGTTPEPAAPADDEQDKVVVVIPIHGELTAETVQVFKEGMKEAKDTKASLAVLVLDTPGGYAAAAIAIADLMDEHETIEFLSYVHGERFGGAWSAGAFLVLCTDGIYLRKGTSIGVRPVTWPPLEMLSGGRRSGSGGFSSGIGLPSPLSVPPSSVPGTAASSSPRLLIQFWTNRPTIGRRPDLLGEAYVSVSSSRLAPGQRASFQYVYPDPNRQVRHVTVEVVDHGRTSSRGSPFSTRSGW